MSEFLNALEGRVEFQRSASKKGALTSRSSLVERGLFWLVPTSRQLDGLWIGAFSDNNERALLRVKKALRLIKVHDPIRYDRLLGDLDRVLVGPLPSSRLGGYVEWLKTCELDSRFVLAKTTSPEQIAATIVHEAAHARLRRRGIGYREEIRGRVEAVCVRRELAFARRLPRGDDVRAEAELRLRLDYDWSDAAMAERRRQGFVEQGVPAWLVRACRAVYPILASRAVRPILGWLLAPLFARPKGRGPDTSGSDAPDGRIRKWHGSQGSSLAHVEPPAPLTSDTLDKLIDAGHQLRASCADCSGLSVNMERLAAKMERDDEFISLPLSAALPRAALRIDPAARPSAFQVQDRGRPQIVLRTSAKLLK
jgi:hypothetical protein